MDKNGIYLRHNELTANVHKTMSSNFGTIDAFSSNSKQGHYVDTTVPQPGDSLAYNQPSESGINVINETPYHDSKAPRLGIDMDKLKMRMVKKNYVANSPENQRNVKDMFSLIGVQQLEIKYPTKAIPVNTDLKKNRKYQLQQAQEQFQDTHHDLISQQNKAEQEYSQKQETLRQGSMQGKEHQNLFLQTLKHQSGGKQNSSFGGSPQKMNTLKLGKQMTSISHDNHEEDYLSSFINQTHQPIYTGNEKGAQPGASIDQDIKVEMYNDRTPNDTNITLTGGHTIENTPISPPKPNLAITEKNQEIKRFLYQLDNIIEFSRDDASDISTLVMLIEQSLNQKLFLNQSNISSGRMNKMINMTLEQIQVEIQSRSGVSNVQKNEFGQDIFNNDLDFPAIQNLGQKLIRTYFFDLWKKEQNSENLTMEDCPYLNAEINRQPVQRAPEIMSKTNSEDPTSNTAANHLAIKIKQQDGMQIQGDSQELHMQHLLNNLSNEQLHDIMSANGSAEGMRNKSNKESVNEIIVNIEMKKFQNLISNRLERKNNLVQSDANRTFPLNKITDGTAIVAQAPMGFTDSLLKFNPKLFNYYEKKAQQKNEELGRNSVNKQLPKFSEQKASHKRLKTSFIQNGEKPYDALPSPRQVTGRESLESNLNDSKYRSFRAAKQSVQEKIKITEELPYVNHKQENARQFSSLIKQRENNKLVSKEAFRKNVFKTNQGIPRTAEPNSRRLQSLPGGKDKLPFQTVGSESQWRSQMSSGGNEQQFVPKHEQKTSFSLNRTVYYSKPVQEKMSPNQSFESLKANFCKEITFKNKYGLGVKFTGNERTATREVSYQRKRATLEDRHGLSHSMGQNSDFAGSLSGYGGQKSKMGQNKHDYTQFQDVEKEPFGWKIGLKPFHSEFQKEQEKLRNQQRKAVNLSQKRAQDHLQRGIDKLITNDTYRKQYENFKSGECKFPNELSRILQEDCKEPIFNQYKVNKLMAFR